MTDSIERFDQLDLPPPLLQALTDVGYETPTHIQAACIPSLLAGHDLLGEAQTGTGKTAAFALPLLARLDLARKAPQVLVLTPTRELAIQVAEAFQRYAHHLPGFHVLPIYGGQSMVVQLRSLSRGAHVIVGTPGRVMDHLERKSLVLDELRALVLDEADEMLRMGFIEDVEWILEHTPATRQTALFSATMPVPIREVARRHLREPQEVKIRTATTTVAAIRQRWWQVARGMDKLEALTRMLEVEENFEAALIFVRTKTATAELAERLEARGYEAAALNGDMTQGLREQVIDRLKGGSLDIVVATDVAARGIDVPRVSHVINYDIPYDTEAYVHRIGRTGRAGRPGTAILFVAPREIRMLRAIERATRQPIERIALPSREAVADRRVAQFKQQVVEALESLQGEELEFFLDVIGQLKQERALPAEDIAQRERPLQPAATGWPEEQPVAGAGLPAISAAPIAGKPAPTRPQVRPEERPRAAAPREFRDEAPGRRGDEAPVRRDEAPVRRDEAPVRRSDDASLRRSDEAPLRRRPAAPGQLVRYRIDVGRNQGAMPKEIVGAIANEGGIEGRFIGQIHLLDDYSTVELPADLPADVLARLKRARVRQCPLNLRPLTPGESETAGERPRPRLRRDEGSERPARWQSGDKPPRRSYGAGSAGAPRSRGEGKFAPRPAPGGKPKRFKP
ncbi:MAG: DEAD/DEAH box helicase [Betaproteobacteria bacterium]|nr:DEAD/DEAH box helicase [Betaproteobacteria bacterium]